MEANEERDRRYRVLVTLQRSDRQAYWTFKCPRCTYPVSELVNMDIIAMNDLTDLSNPTLHADGVRCDGRFEGGHCRIWYYFSLGK